MTNWTFFQTAPTPQTYNISFPNTWPLFSQKKLRNSVRRFFLLGIPNILRKLLPGSKMTPRLLPNYALFWVTLVQPVHSDAVQALAGGTLSALKPPPTARCWWKQKGLKFTFLNYSQSQTHTTGIHLLEFLIIHWQLYTVTFRGL